jgi:aspartate aminotransferase
MKLSERAVHVQASPIRKLKPYADAAVKKGIHIYHLNIGQPDIETPKPMIDEIHRFNEKVLEYGPSQGLDSYRINLVRYYKKVGINIEPSDIIVTTAGSEAIVFAMLVACDPGDEIITFEPFYTNYNGFASMTDIELKPITTHAEDGFAMPDDATIEKAITSRSRAIMVCNPGNPTGTVYPKTDLERLAAICRKHNLYLISDEVYREFIYDGLTHTSVMQIEGMEDNAILVDSISKRYSACGARIGCIISRNKTFMAATLKFAQARLCPPTIEQMAANACIDLDDSYINAIIKEYDKRRNIVFEELQQIPGIVCRKPGGAFYIIAKLPIENAEDFALWLLNEFSENSETVMVAPAEGFYATPGLGRNEVRLAYILNENALRSAMKLFRNGLAKYRQIRGL